MSLTDIDTNLLRVFSEQIFHTGFVHADPHPGNILIRKVDGKAQIVLLGKISRTALDSYPCFLIYMNSIISGCD